VQATGLMNVTNFVAADGGADAEVLDDAEVRARKELSTRSRAVTASDFQWIALQTPTARVARAVPVPFERPLSGGANGLNPTMAPGVVSVVAVPLEGGDGPEPLPTRTFLRAVCAQLDAHRLVTTEVYAVPPQYARIVNLRVIVNAQPGYTRSQLQDLVGARLAEYLHVLTGGVDGSGFPFGSQIHIADLIAQVFRVEGVERVVSLQADFERTKSNAVPRKGFLRQCPDPNLPNETDHIDLAPEETASFDANSFSLGTAV
jgi:predicted phage baseplate assembly protein